MSAWAATNALSQDADAYPEWGEIDEGRWEKRAEYPSLLCDTCKMFSDLPQFRQMSAKLRQIVIRICSKYVDVDFCRCF